MSRFDTLGFSDLGTGNGVSRDFPIAGQDEAVTDFAVESVRRDGWQGQVIMSPIPRTNYATYSNDFTRPEWNGSPSLLLGFKDQRYFVVDSSGALQQKPFSDIITFTRASGGGRFNAQGVYEWLPANEPRIDYDPVTGECRGLLIEEQRTNLLTYSSDFTNAAWTQSGASIGGADNSGWVTLTEDASNSTHGIQRTYPAQVSANRVFSIDVMSNTATKVVLRLGGANTVFNLQTGVAESGSIRNTPIVSPLGAGAWRLSIAQAAEEASTIATSVVRIANESGADTYAGNGSRSIKIRFPQLENGSFPTSYIPTTDAQVTRAASDPLLETLPPWFNPTAGTFVIEHDARDGAPLLSSGDELLASSAGAGRTVLAYDTTGSYVSQNGGEFVAGPPLTFGDSLRLMRSATQWANAHCKALRYYQCRLTLAEASA